MKKTFSALALMGCITAHAGVKELSQITATAETIANADWQFQLPGAAALTQGDMIVVYVSASSQNPSGHEVIWFNKDGDGTPPSSPLYASAYNTVQIDISTGDTKEDIAANVSLTGGTVNFQMNDFGGGLLDAFYFEPGATANPVSLHSAGSANAAIVVTVVTPGADVSLDGGYFFLWSANNATKYYGWLKTLSPTDPAPAGAVSLNTDIGGVDNPGIDPGGWGYDFDAAGIAASIAASINYTAGADFNAVANGAVVDIECKATGATTNIQVGSGLAPFTFRTIVEGS